MSPQPSQRKSPAATSADLGSDRRGDLFTILFGERLKGQKPQFVPQQTAVGIPYADLEPHMGNAAGVILDRQDRSGLQDIVSENTAVDAAQLDRLQIRVASE